MGIFSNAFKALPDGAKAYYQSGKAGIGALFGFGQLRDIGSNLGNAARNLERAARVRNYSGAAKMYLENAAGPGRSALSGLRGWATGAGSTGWKRAGQVAARMGPVAGVAGLGAWGLNRNSR